MTDEIKPKWYIKLWNWFYRLISCKPITDNFKKLIDKNDPMSSHRAVNITWGLGSFGFYWLDHFLYKRVFTNQDYMFILAMAGISTVAAIRAKRLDSDTTTEDSDDNASRRIDELATKKV